MAERTLRPSPNVAAVLVLAVLAAALLVWQRPWGGGTADAPEVVPIPGDAPTLLSAQLRELSAATSESDFVTASGDLPAGRAFGRRTWASLTALGATDVSLRYISGGDVADRADGTARMVAEVAWRPGADSGLGTDSIHRSTVSFRVAPQEDGGLSIVEAAPQRAALPIWLAGAVTVGRTSGGIVVAVDGGDGRTPIESMTATARAAVDGAVPGTRGDVVVLAPRTQDQMAEIVGQDVGEVRQIAAVTTRLDRGATSSRDAVIVLNPAVFATMDRRAAQVVLSHEATHLLTGAVGTRAESWVVEGFADYVALRDDSAPLSVSAGQVLAEVTAGRGPERLPDSADFEATSHGLGAVYEGAWMIFRLLGEDYGRADVVGFYEAVLGGTDLTAALQDSFGLTEQQLTTRWLTYLTKSASTVS